MGPEQRFISVVLNWGCPKRLRINNQEEGAPRAYLIIYIIMIISCIVTFIYMIYIPNIIWAVPSEEPCLLLKHTHNR